MNCLIPVVGLLALPTLSSGAIIIDTFTDVNDPSGIQNITLQSSPTATPDTLTSTQASLSEVIGGEREFTLTRTATSGIGARRVSGTVSDANPPFFEYESSVGADGFAVLAYGSDSSPLNEDFSQNGLIQVLIASYDLPGNIPLETSLTLSSGLGGASPVTTTTVDSLATNGGLIIFDLSAPEYATLDFTDIDAISFQFDAPFAGDFNINTIIADDVPLQIPEPSAPALLAAGLSALALRRKRL